MAVVNATLRPLYPRVPIVQEAVWTDAENLTPPGFDPQTVKPVASRYTD